MLCRLRFPIGKSLMQYALPAQEIRYKTLLCDIPLLNESLFDSNPDCFIDIIVILTLRHTACKLRETVCMRQRRILAHHT